MYYSYSANDYRYYLAHHGIRGQKWGHKNGPPYPLDASDHSASERKAGWRKSLDSPGIKARMKDRVGGIKSWATSTVKNVKAADGIWEKGSELFGSGQDRTRQQVRANTQRALANHSRTKLFKRYHDQQSRNAKALSDYHAKKKAKTDIRNKNKLNVLANMLIRGTVLDADLLRTPYNRLSGRNTTRGMNWLDTYFTSGAAGLGLDAVYLINNRNKK